MPPFNSASPAAASDSAAADPLPAPRTITVGVAKLLLRREFDPDKAISILSTVSSPTSSRYALDLTVRRLARARRPADVETLINTHKSSPNASHEGFIAMLIRSYGTAGMLDHGSQIWELVVIFILPHATPQRPPPPPAAAPRTTARRIRWRR